MQRINCAARRGWQEAIKSQGITFSEMPQPDGSIHHYWKEDVYYVFSDSEVEELEKHSEKIFEMLVEAGDRIANLPIHERRELLLRMKIPEFAHKATIDSWKREPESDDQSVYGRFDLRHVGPGIAPKLYEFNAQTPTSLMESGYAQWKWLQDVSPASDQWNSIWEKLIDAWRRNLGLWGDRMGFDPTAHPAHKPTVHFAYSESENQGEDELTVTYLANACAEAGYAVRIIQVEQIKLYEGRFYVPRTGVSDVQDSPTGNKGDEEYDLSDLERLNICFMLYPYEWVWEQEFGRAMYADMEYGPRLNSKGQYIGGTIWFEAPYKMLWSNKAILPVLWQFFGNHPQYSQYLIPAWWHDQKPLDLKDYVEKPIFAREGANIRVFRGGKLVDELGGDYASDDPADYIVQQWQPPTTFDDGNGQPISTIIGVWMIDGEPGGMSVREDQHAITGVLGHFVPHLITPDGEAATMVVAPVATMEAPEAPIAMWERPPTWPTIERKA